MSSEMERHLILSFPDFATNLDGVRRVQELLPPEAVVAPVERRSKGITDIWISHFAPHVAALNLGQWGGSTVIMDATPQGASRLTFVSSRAHGRTEDAICGLVLTRETGVMPFIRSTNDRPGTRLDALKEASNFVQRRTAA